MKDVISSGGLFAKLWIDKDKVEESALKQIINLTKLPFAYRHIAIMPDTHTGYGMPIGGVMATEGVIIPNAVGVDIGCGMRACKTSLDGINKDALKEIMGLIRQRVPVGFNHNKEKCGESKMPFSDYIFDKEKLPIVNREFEKAQYQLGTLGSGNHFLELQIDEDGKVWIMIHSGSRNFGKQIADHYNNLAVQLNEKWHTQVPKEYQLAFLPIDSKEGEDYIREMNYALDFAKLNRQEMMNRIKSSFEEVIPETKFVDSIDIHHNYAAMEHHFGKNVMVHRKGATSAREGGIGIIPGSQGTNSYIVEGLGNPESFYSCSHGAGRKMSRKAAKERLSLEDEKKRLDDQGIVHGIRHINDLDEASGAYKDIEEVMENQKDLVKIKHRLKPIGVIKG